MKVLLLATGSGGHVFPCVELYKRKEDVEVLYLSFKDGFERSILIKNHIHFEEIPFSMKRKKWDIHTWIRLFQFGKQYKDYDAIIGGGGIASFIAFRIHLSTHKPLYLLEQNIVLGDCNRLAYPFSKKVFSYFPLRKNILAFGNPREDAFSLKSHTKGILFFAGSLGSSSLIHRMEAALIQLKKKYPILIVSKYPLKELTTIPCLENMEDVLPTFRVAISRAGATTICELIKAQVPAILFPSPFVKHDHQRKNAQWYQKELQIPYFNEDSMIEENLIQLVEKLYENGKYRDEIIKKMASLSHDSVSKTIWNHIKN